MGSYLISLVWPKMVLLHLLHGLCKTFGMAHASDLSLQ